MLITPLSNYDPIEATVTVDSHYGTSAVMPDATGAAHIRAKLAVGELVKVPLRLNDYVLDSTNSTAFTTQFEQNEDGSNSGVTFSVAGSALGTSQAYIEQIVYGTVVGVRFTRNASVNSRFSVIIDGMAYGVNVPIALIDNQTASFTDGEALVIVATDLPDTAHTVKVIVQPDPAGSATKSLYLYGFLAERRAGYENKPRVQALLTPAAVPNTSTAIPATNGVGRAFRGVRGVLYTNTTGSAVTLTIYYGSTQMYSASIAANSSWTWDLLGPTAFDSSWKHQAGTASALNFSVLGVI